MPNRLNQTMPTSEREGAEHLGTRAELLLSPAARFRRRAGSLIGRAFLLLVTAVSALAVLFIFAFIARDAIPFFRSRGVVEFFTGTRWYPAGEPAEFGAFPIFFGSAMVTVGACAVAVPLGIAAAVCLSDVLPFRIRQIIKPVIEMLAAIPSVAYGFFALVVFAPALQNHGTAILRAIAWIPGLPAVLITSGIIAELLAGKVPENRRSPARGILFALSAAALGLAYGRLTGVLAGIEITSGANALNASIILGIMALPTIVSVSEDALQAVSRELREGSYALGATRAETVVKVVLPAAAGGICAAVILGIMRAVGETMVVWMASGNSPRIPSPPFNFLQPIRTLTANIAGDMGEADHVTGSDRYHVLFAMALCLLAFAYLLNTVSEWVARRAADKTGKRS